MGENESPYYEKGGRYLWAFAADDIVSPLHLHEEAEFMCCLEGSFHATVMDESRTVTAGDCALIFPGQIHGYRPVGHGRLLIVIFSPVLAGAQRGLLQKYCPQQAFLKSDCLPEDARIALERLRLTAVREKRDLCAAWLGVLLAALLPQLALQEDRGADSMDLTRRLLEYVREHFQQPLTLDRLAAELHVNKYYLSHIFSRKLQMNFREYLNRIRLSYAEQLITTTDRPLTEIWAESGFESQSSFNRIFREAEGMTPREYRERGLK